ALKESVKRRMAKSRPLRSVRVLAANSRARSAATIPDFISRGPRTITLKRHSTLLQASVTSTLTGVVPIGKRVPDGGLNTAVATEQPPVILASKVATVPVSLRN